MGILRGSFATIIGTVAKADSEGIPVDSDVAGDLALPGIVRRPTGKDRLDTIQSVLGRLKTALLHDKEDCCTSKVQYVAGNGGASGS